MSELGDAALEVHRQAKGKIEVRSKLPLRNERDLSLAYTPGVATPCKEIARDPDKVYEYTAKSNLVAVVSNGTAVLGLGNIGPEAALPVMEGKSILFKAFGGVDAIPICIDAPDASSIIDTVTRLAPTFGGINLEDIAAPACFEVEAQLKKTLDIPVFHDDQHGTAVVVTAGLLNALSITGRDLNKVSIVINGAGSAGLAITRLLLKLGVSRIMVCDSRGIIYSGRSENMNRYKDEVATMTNPDSVRGVLSDALVGADVFIGVSKARQVTPEMIGRMAKDPIIFALANPDPEIQPEDAMRAGAAVVATGRSDFPNQVNNVLAFPGIFRGALDVRASDINDEMKIAAARAIASLAASDLRADHIIPNPFDRRVALEVATATAKAAVASGVSRLDVDIEAIARHLDT